MRIIQNLKIKDSNYTFKSENKEKLANLSRVNLFIGKNNSGKSRFLRSIFYKKEDNLLNFTLSNNEKFKYFQEKAHELNKKLNNHQEIAKLERKYNFNTKSIKKHLYLDDYIIESKNIYQYNGKNSKPIPIDIQTKRFFEEYFDEINMKDNDLFKYNFYKIYIPTLRGLIPLRGRAINLIFNIFHYFLNLK